MRRTWLSLVLNVWNYLVFSTTSHPWYLLWALILLPAAFSPAVWIASLTLPGPAGEDVLYRSPDGKYLFLVNRGRGCIYWHDASFIGDMLRRFES